MQRYKYTGKAAQFANEVTYRELLMLTVVHALKFMASFEDRTKK
jgi:hypothetical protein